MQAQTAREHVDSFSINKWTLRRILVEFFRGADSPKPPQEPEAHYCSHVVDAAPTESMRS